MRTPTFLYHITHLRNLSSILALDGLQAHNVLERDGIPFDSIAYPHIQDRRAKTRVSCGPGGVLHDYVPFYFAPRSPMLYTISRGNVAAYQEGQGPIIHLVTTAQLVSENNLKFVFTDGHAVMSLTKFFSELSYLDRIDWDIMKAKQWSDNTQDTDRKRRRSAEFLIYEYCPWTIIKWIGVYNSKTYRQVEGILQGTNKPPVVQIRPKWYY